MKINDNRLFCEGAQVYMMEVINQYENVIYKFIHLAKNQMVCDGGIFDEEDLYQEGCLALIQAYASYDERKGAFSTWVYHNVRDAMREYKKNNLSHLSGGGYAVQTHNQAGSWEPEEMMKQGMTKKTAIAAMVYGMRPIRYGQAINMVDRRASAQLSAIENHYSRIDYAKYLSEKETIILEHYYGLNGTEKLTMGEIGYILGISRKAVSYSLNQAIVKLRHIDGIEEYLYIR